MHCQLLGLRMDDESLNCCWFTRLGAYLQPYLSSLRVTSNPAPSHERAWYTLFMHALDFHTFPCEKSMGEDALL